MSTISILRDFIAGFTSYAQAAPMLWRKNTWKLAIIPGICGLLFSGFTVFLIVQFADSIGDWIVRSYQLEWGRAFISAAADWVAGLSIGVLSLLIFKYAILVISAPFMSPLSERIEEHYYGLSNRTGFSMSQMLYDIGRSLRINVRNFIREIGITLLLLLLSFFPPFTLISPLLIYVTQSYYAGFGNMDYTMERYFGVGESVQFVRKHWSLAIANGMVFLFLLTIPFIGVFLAVPLACVSSTIETVKRVRPVYYSTNL